MISFPFWIAAIHVFDQKLWNKIKSLDFKLVKEKLEYRKGRAWCKKHDLERLEKEYRQFLYLIGTNQTGFSTVPWSQELDDFWHEHILDTRRYAQDCDAVFGRMIRHNPHLNKGTKAQTDSDKETKASYKVGFETPDYHKDEGGFFGFVGDIFSGLIDAISASCGGASSCGGDSSCGNSCSSCGGCGGCGGCGD